MGTNNFLICHTCKERLDVGKSIRFQQVPDDVLMNFLLRHMRGSISSENDRHRLEYADEHYVFELDYQEKDSW